MNRSRSGLSSALRIATRVVHEGMPPDARTGAVNPPVYLTSTFAQAAPGEAKGFVYSRTGNPTRAVLERVLARLEGGIGALAFGSGLAATSALLMSLPSGARIVAGDDLYAGALRLLGVARRNGVLVDLIDTTRPGALRAAFEGPGSVGLLYLESPTNPLLRITDLRAAIALARRHRTLVCVDNTFASPLLQHPLALGADVALHSTTKYIGGHSDLIGGALVFRRRSLLERIRWYQNTAGGIPGPMDCYLTLRGVRTLSVRMRAHCDNAERVAAFLSDHPRVRRTLYPGLRSHPGHAVARGQMDRFGGMVSAELEGGWAEVRRAVRRLRVFTLAESLGGVESLVNHPARMTHRSVHAEERAARGITPGLLRFSVGIEDPEDLLDDLRGALAR